MYMYLYCNTFDVYISFRLTILKDGMEICEQISKCISPEGGMNSSGDGIISSGNLIEANKDHENEHENANPDIKLEVSHTTNGRSIEHVIIITVRLSSD